jgi:hypothetical protein
MTMGFIVAAALLPLAYRWYAGRRAAPQSRITSLHVAVGLVVALAAFVHALMAVMSLGTAQAIGAGNLGLALGGIAVFVLMAHVGIGLQLRRPKLRDRPAMRAKHRFTALTIVSFAVAHTILVWANR